MELGIWFGFRISGFGFHPSALRGDRYAGCRLNSKAMADQPITLAEFQKHIAERYELADRARGWSKTFAYFIEEVGELATALSAEGKDPQNLREEFADVLAWLCTLANVSDVDLSDAVAQKYLGKDRPEGTK